MSGSFDQTVEFGMREELDDPEVVRLVLSGELDLAVAKIFGDRLRMLRQQGYAVRLDLAGLEFIDSSGLRELVVARSEARSDGWRFEIDPRVSAPVRRVLEISGLDLHLWPNGG